MHTENILEQILKSGQQMLLHGREVAEETLNIPEQGIERDVMLMGLGKGALITGGLAALLGTSAGRRLTSGTLKLGGLASIGGLAYQTYQTWHQKDAQLSISPQSNEAEAKLENSTLGRSRLLVKAMVAAAKADGLIDAKERLRITMQICELGLDDNSATFIACEMEKPLDASKIAAEVDNPETAAEIYLVSRAIIDVGNEQERSYLNDLEKALNLPEELITELDKNIA